MAAPESPPWIVWPVLVVIQFFFAGFHVWGKVALTGDGCNPYVFALYREGFASVGMWALALSIDGAMLPKKRSHYFLVALMGTMSFINVVFSALALDLVSAPNAAMLQPAVPVLALLWGMALKIEKATRVKALGMLVSGVGAVLIVVLTAEDSGTKSEQIILGNVLLIFQCICGSLLVVLWKFVVGTYPSITITAWYYSFGFVLTGIFIGAVVRNKEDYLVTSGDIWAAIAYTVVFATVFNYCAMTWTSKYVNPSITTGFLTLQPVATIVLSAVFLSFRPQLPTLAAAAAVIVGVLVLCYGQYVERVGESELQTDEFQDAKYVHQIDTKELLSTVSDSSLEHCGYYGKEANNMSTTTTTSPTHSAAAGLLSTTGHRSIQAEA